MKQLTKGDYLSLSNRVTHEKSETFSLDKYERDQFYRHVAKIQDLDVALMALDDYAEKHGIDYEAFDTARECIMQKIREEIVFAMHHNVVAKVKDKDLDRYLYSIVENVAL